MCPISPEVKLIDFGGATYADEHHTAIINTRQYRAPEVILGCQQWDTKSDIWSMVCIFAELYTGEMFFSTHENVEHLALMEKVCGPIPKHMAENS
jgi:serine/threonine protein kinase